MEYKNSFVCYESVYRQFERMVQRGKQETAIAFIVAVMRYGLYGEKPDEDSEIWDLGFDGIIATISSAKAKYGKAIDKALEDGIFYILNNLNLRHNNTVEEDKHYKKAVAEMDSATLEDWYDELYQMMLLAYLQLDQMDRNTRVKALKQAVSPK